MPYVERSGDVFVLYFGEEGEPDSENAFHPDWIDKVEGLLDQVEQHDGPAALVTTGLGKFYSTGLDTAWVVANTDKLNSYIDRVQALFARILTFPPADRGRPDRAHLRRRRNPCGGPRSPGDA